MAGGTGTRPNDSLIASAGGADSQLSTHDTNDWQHRVINAQAKSADNQSAKKSAVVSADSGQRPDWNNMSQTALDIFKEVDTNNTGEITRPMLAAAIQDGKFNGEKAPLLSAIYDNFDKIAVTTRTSHSSPTQSLKASNIKDFFQAMKVTENQFYVVNNLAHWGYSEGNVQRFSDNGSMTKQSLQKTLSRNDISAQDRTQLENLNKNFDSISKNGHITALDLALADKNFEANDHNFNLSNSFLGDMALVRTIQNADVQNLFATSDPVKSVTPDAVRAGFVGNCTFEAALASLAAARPQDIPQMMHQSGGGKVEVDFPGTKKTITVNPLTDAEQGLFDKASMQGLWNNVLQNANGQLLAKEHGSSKMLLPEESGDLDPMQDAAITRVTGHTVDNSLLSRLSLKDLNDQLIQASQNHRVVDFDTRAQEKSDASSQATTPMGFLIDHAFSLIRVNTSGAQVTSVVVRDPRDHGHDRPDGEMQITLAQLKDNFSTMSVETNRPANKH